MVLRKSSAQTKQKILSTCVRLFLQQGYTNTSVSQIVKESQVSRGSLQNLFHTKDAILMELEKSMFTKQFSAAKQRTKDILPPVYTYALETALQLTLTELNENLREIYIVSYTIPNISEFIQIQTTHELFAIFASYFPNYTEQDFYNLEIGTAGIMRSYMVKKCDIHFSLETKINSFLQASLRVYKVDENEIQAILNYVHSLDLIQIANETINNMFEMLELQYDFKLTNNT